MHRSVRKSRAWITPVYDPLKETLMFIKPDLHVAVTRGANSMGAASSAAAVWSNCKEKTEQYFGQFTISFWNAMNKLTINKISHKLIKRKRRKKTHNEKLRIMNSCSPWIACANYCIVMHFETRKANFFSKLFARFVCVLFMFEQETNAKPMTKNKCQVNSLPLKT